MVWFMAMTVVIVLASAMVFTTLLADSQHDPANHFNVIDSTLLELLSFTASGIDVGTLDDVRDHKGGPRSCWAAGQLGSWATAVSTAASSGAASCSSHPAQPAPGVRQARLLACTALGGWETF
jgi:hypothetical protein